MINKILTSLRQIFVGSVSQSQHTEVVVQENQTASQAGSQTSQCVRVSHVVQVLKKIEIAVEGGPGEWVMLGTT